MHRIVTSSAIFALSRDFHCLHSMMTQVPELLNCVETCLVDNKALIMIFKMALTTKSLQKDRLCKIENKEFVQ